MATNPAALAGRPLTEALTRAAAVPLTGSRLAVVNGISADRIRAGHAPQGHSRKASNRFTSGPMALARKAHAHKAHADKAHARKAHARKAHARKAHARKVRAAMDTIARGLYRWSTPGAAPAAPGGQGARHPQRQRLAVRPPCHRRRPGQSAAAAAPSDPDRRSRGHPRPIPPPALGAPARTDGPRQDRSASGP